jgi:hypothetical protein
MGGLIHWSCWLWVACLLVTLGTATVAVAGTRCWRRPDARATGAELVLLCGVGFVVRRFLMSTVLLDWPSRMPLPWVCSEPRNGPGYHTFANLCYLLGGVGDRSVVTGIVLMGALTAAPVYLLVRLATGHRSWGFAAGLAIALLEPHARMSNADDPAALVALLVVSALALAEAGRATGGAWFAPAACLTAALAAMTRPEVFSAFAVVIAFLVLDPSLRALLRRPAVLALSLAGCLVAAASLAGAVGTRHAAGQPLLPGALATVDVLWGLFTRHLVVLPPEAPAVFGALLGLGVIVAVRASRGTAIAWLLTGLAPVVASMRDAGTSVAQKHQVSLLPVAAAFAGVGAAWLCDQAAARAPRRRLLVQIAAGLAGLAVLGWWLRHPQPPPTFALEYQFFESHLAMVPRGCTVMFPRTPGGYGLQTPTHLSALRGLDHQWTRASDRLDPEDGCLMYWKPAACHHGLVPDAWVPWSELLWDFGWMGDSEDGTVLDMFVPPRDCFVVERAYRLEPVAETILPGRLGHRGMFRSDAVPVGFYRARALSVPVPK